MVVITQDQTKVLIIRHFGISFSENPQVLIHYTPHGRGHITGCVERFCSFYVDITGEGQPIFLKSRIFNRLHLKRMQANITEPVVIITKRKQAGNGPHNRSCADTLGSQPLTLASSRFRGLRLISTVFVLARKNFV